MRGYRYKRGTGFKKIQDTDTKKMRYRYKRGTEFKKIQDTDTKIEVPIQNEVPDSEKFKLPIQSEVPDSEKFKSPIKKNKVPDSRKMRY
jgi:hypothetical protein